MTSLLSLLLILFLIVALVIIFQSMGAIARDILDIFPLLSRSYEKQDRSLAELIHQEFPIGQERIFSGYYIAHWEIGGFNWDKGFFCQLEIPTADGWEWLWKALGYPTTRAECAGKFELSFRGKMLEAGHFGHMGMCSYRIEVIEILTAIHVT